MEREVVQVRSALTRGVQWGAVPCWISYQILDQLGVLGLGRYHKIFDHTHAKSYLRPPRTAAPVSEMRIWEARTER